MLRLNWNDSLECMTVNRQLCGRGEVLRHKVGSACHGCYRICGLYGMPRSAAIQSDNEGFFSAVEDGLIARQANTLSDMIRGEEYFRWFSVGDVRSSRTADLILRVCAMTPDTKHLVFSRDGLLPTNGAGNLSVLRSGDWIDRPDTGEDAVVFWDRIPKGFFPCPKNRGAKCGSCRYCWRPRKERRLPVGLRWHGSAVAYNRMVAAGWPERGV